MKNVVFDMVGVLMRFDTDGYFNEHSITSADRNIIRLEVFRSLEWAKQDRGTVSEEDAAMAICARVPARLHSVVKDLVYRQNRAILPVQGMEALLNDLKTSGHRLFLLSNTSLAFHRFRQAIPGIAYIEDTLISADVGLVKPDPALFHLACKRFGIIPSESAFVDDSPINAEAACHVGMNAFVFNDDVDALREWLGSIGWERFPERHRPI